MYEPFPDCEEFAPEWFEPCPPMFVERGDGWALTADAQRHLDAIDPPTPTIADRLRSVRIALTSLARDLPAAARVMSPHDLLDAVEVLQQATNLLGSCDQAVVAELDRRDVHVPVGATSCAQLLSDHLRIRPAEAQRRVKTARSCAERVAFGGSVLPPLREKVAAAQASGAISADHACTIASALDSLPTGIAVDELDLVEAALVELAGSGTPPTSPPSAAPRATGSTPTTPKPGNGNSDAAAA